MATYKIDSSLLTAQADEIRELNGTTATMNPSQMTTALQSANAEVATQEQKIIEITEMLQGKAMGSGGSGGGSIVQSCTVTIINELSESKYIDGLYVDTEDSLQHFSVIGQQSSVFSNVDASKPFIVVTDYSALIVSDISGFESHNCYSGMSSMGTTYLSYLYDCPSGSAQIHFYENNLFPS